MSKPPNITKLADGDLVRMALVCGSGFGKTVFCGTAPNALFLTTDPEGTISARRMGSTAEEWKIESWNDKGGLMDAYTWMVQEGQKTYDWLIHDNATEEQYLAQQRSIGVRLKRRPDGDPYIPEQKDYQYAQNGFIQVTKQFRALNMHQIWTVHRAMMTREDAEGDVVDFYSANIQGKAGAIAEQFLGYMNVIGMGEVIEKDKKLIRRIYFDHVRQYRGKDRFQALGRYQDDLTVPRMMELIEASKTSAGARPRRATKKTAATRRRLASA